MSDVTRKWLAGWLGVASVKLAEAADKVWPTYSKREFSDLRESHTFTVGSQVAQTPKLSPDFDPPTASMNPRSDGTRCRCTCHGETQ